MKKQIFCILKVTEDLGTDPHAHPDPHPHPLVRVRIRGSGSGPKCHGSGTLEHG
jgi:hypothetical protein